MCVPAAAAHDVEADTGGQACHRWYELPLTGGTCQDLEAVSSFNHEVIHSNDLEVSREGSLAHQIEPIEVFPKRVPPVSMTRCPYSLSCSAIRRWMATTICSTAAESSPGTAVWELLYRPTLKKL
jgi:hypothetical protein